MNGLGREEAPFSGHIWQQIDQTVNTVRAANGTARRFLPVDGPYGLGLMSVAGGEQFRLPVAPEATAKAWNVTQATGVKEGDVPAGVHGGTYLVRGVSRPVPLIASEFFLGIRAVEAYDAGCMPLDLCAATTAARDVALEEERLLYYGFGASDPNDQALLAGNCSTEIYPDYLFDGLQLALRNLAGRGYAGPFALAVDPRTYLALYSPITHLFGNPVACPVLLVDLLRNLFRGGVYMVPAITPDPDPEHRLGAIVTVGRAYSRLVIGQDWVTTFRGRDGVLYRFLIMDSLQLRICDYASIEVLVQAKDTQWRPPYQGSPQTSAGGSSS